MKKKIVGLFVLCTCLALSACSFGKAELTRNTVQVAKDGKITEVLIDLFDQDYYDLTELEEMAKNEIAVYNDSVGKNEITYLSGVEDEEHNVKVKIEYTSPEAYATFNDISFFYGSVTDAYKYGYRLDMTLTEVKNHSKQIGLDELLGMGDNMILIMDQDMDVEVPSEILYTSGNVTDVDGKLATVLYDGNPVVLLCK